jgi:hypothetical protein
LVFAFARSTEIILPARESSSLLEIANLSAETTKYEDKSIVIDESEEKIVGVGDDADAERNGYRDTILFKAHRLILPFPPEAVKYDQPLSW